MPYGFFTIVRFAATCGFVYMSYEYFSQKQNKLGFVFAALSLLFQPFVKISLGRIVWNYVDVAVAAFLIYLIIKTFDKKK